MKSNARKMEKKERKQVLLNVSEVCAQKCPEDCLEISYSQVGISSLDCNKSSIVVMPSNSFDTVTVLKEVEKLITWYTFPAFPYEICLIYDQNVQEDKV